MSLNFQIVRKQGECLARAGICSTEHGDIETPAFVAVATRGSVKALTPEQIKDAGLQVVLGNTYHLYLEPGQEVVREAGGLGKMMNWSGPTMTDSGGFQVFSLGHAFGTKMSKFGLPAKNFSVFNNKIRPGEDNVSASALLHNSTAKISAGRLARIDEQGVTFRSHIDGSEHRFTPEKSIQIQHDLGADIIFAFDECPSPEASYDYQIEAMERTHRWAGDSLLTHEKLGGGQSLFGIVQGGRFEDLRKKSAKVIGLMSFDGFGIGGSFEKKDMASAVRWVNEILPQSKPRHLLGIGEPEDLILAIENGCDFFDCVMPTRLGRNGTLYTRAGKINATNTRFSNDYGSIEKNCRCYTCVNFSMAYLSHLFRVKEMLAATLASIHNLFFIAGLVSEARTAIINDQFMEYKKGFLDSYKSCKQ